MRELASVSWSWFMSQMEIAPPRSRRRRHLRRSAAFSTFAAEVQHLEPRALLTVTYHGGALLTAVEAQPVYLGGDWSTTAALNTQTGQINQFVSTLVNSPYMDMLSNAGYKVGRGTETAGAIDNVALSKTASVGVTDGQIQGYLQSMITTGQLQAPDANRLYVVYVEPGVVVHDGSDASNTTFLGYHGAFGGKTAGGQAADIHYAVIPYPGSPNFSPGSQGFATAFDEMTSVSSHEIAEAATDPNVDYKVLGWYDDQLNGEIGDLTDLNSVMSGYVVQDLVDQNDKVIAPGTTTQPPPPPVVTPPTLAAKALSTTTAQLSWNAVSGSPQGYKVYETIGSQTTLVATLGATTTSYQATGLTAGSTVSFKVQAYNANSSADSNVVKVTMPTLTPPPTLTAPQVTTTVLSSTSALLSWNTVSGAQGYRIYWLNGNQQVLLGTVGSSATGVQIVGLTPGSTAKFMVEAFNGITIADSVWVSVTTPSRHGH